MITLSDTYNENEIIRLKHLNEFARQLRVKLDGQTDPKPERTVTKISVRESTENGGYRDVIFPSDGTLTFTQSKLYGYSRFFITFYTPPTDSAKPYCEISSTDPNSTIEQRGISFNYRVSNPANVIVLDTDSYPKRTVPLDPQTITFKCVFPEGDTYARYEKTLTVIVVPDE